MLTLERVRALTEDVECDVDGVAFRWAVTVAYESETGSALSIGLDVRPIGFFVQLRYDEPDIETGVMEEQRALKWFVDKDASDGEVYQRMLRAHLASAEHRVREHFKVKGVLAYGPHQGIEERRAGALLTDLEAELRRKAVEWRNAEDLDGRTIRDDFNSVADWVAKARG